MITSIDTMLLATIGDALAKNEMVRCNLPDGSRLHIDRQLPFLCVYRHPIHRYDAGTERLLLGEASYLLASANERHHSELIQLVYEISHRQCEYFGAFLLFELWSAEAENIETQPLFNIYALQHNTPQLALEELETELLAIQLDGYPTRVKISYQDIIRPPGLRPLLVNEEKNIVSLGLEISPIYRNSTTGELFPFELRALHHALARVLKRTFYTFTHSHTKHRPAHYNELGRHAMTRVVSDVDEKLASISQRFDLLLHVTPVNVMQAWDVFRDSKFNVVPEFLYRPRPFDPALMKRELFSIPIEQIEDPTLAYIYEQKQTELDRKINLISDRNTPEFLFGSRQLFGNVEEDLSMLAESILNKLTPHTHKDKDSDLLSADQFAELARLEIKYYQTQHSSFMAEVEVRKDITGIMVSKGNLLIGKDASVSRSRVESVLAHEIGTHILTYFNGQQQPLREFYTGMVGYDAMQEGLAVLAEYLTDGLTHARLRQLAGRVVAVQSIYNGANFIETFRLLHDQYGFSLATAFNISMRIYRGGGYTKDVVYLRGLMNLLSYLAQGKDFEMLFLGKINNEHLSLIEELQWRKVLLPAVLRPGYLDKPETQRKLTDLRNGMSVVDLALNTVCD